MQIPTQHFSSIASEEREKGRKIANATQGIATHLPNLQAVKQMALSLQAHKADTAPYPKNNLAIDYYAKRCAQALSSYYNNPDIAELQNRIGFFVGGQQAYSVLTRAILEKHQDLEIYTQRGYPNYIPTISEELRGQDNWEISTLSIDNHDYKGSPTFQELEKVAENSAKATVIILTNPSNPEGKFLGEDIKSNLSKLMREHPNLYIIFDESFIEMNLTDDGKSIELATSVTGYTGNQTSVAASLDDCEDLQSRVAILRSGTKMAGLASERLNLTILPNDQEIIQSVANIISKSTYSTPESVQSGMLGWLDAYHKAPQSVTQQAISYYRDNLCVLKEGLSKINIELSTPDAGFFTLIDFSSLKGSSLPRGLSEKIDFQTIETDEDIAKLLMYMHPDKGLAVIPASTCNYKAEDCKVRLCFGMSPEDISLALEVITFTKNLSKTPTNSIFK